MFQTYEETASPAQGRERLPLLRAELLRLELDGLILPRTDAHQSEYLVPGDERLSWLTGFTGSAGTVVVLTECAALFVDGRYTVQAPQQVDTDLFEIVNVANTSPTDWLAANLAEGARLAYDPWLHTVSGLKKLMDAVGTAQARVIPVEENPVHTIWRDRPGPTEAAIEPHPLELSGMGTADKLVVIREALAKDRDDAVVLSLADSIAWAFNIRGRDVAHTPVALAFAVISLDSATLFVAPGKVTPDVEKWLEPHTTLAPPSSLESALREFGEAGQTIRIDPASTASAIASILTDAGASLHEAPDPCIARKAKKNDVEIDGARTAQARDAVAMARFLAWIEDEATDGSVDEITAAKRLEAFRGESNELRDISFDTISASGPNAALAHYRVSEASNRMLEAGELYLVDSGGQYRDGTTDITRTVVLGSPDDELKRLFTLVLKGHIAIATARFPVGTTGAQLDTLARTALWQAGFDYDHGTGHGIGSYLSVHEGPQSLSKRGHTPLEPGMLLSNEPGYYREGHFGIRIENLVLVTEPEPIEGGDRVMLQFETLTYTPIDRRLIEPKLLTASEREWINAYHRQCLKRLEDSGLSNDQMNWLRQATQAV